MKLESFRVTCYKNVLDSTEVSVEPEVTVLVGVNESGKSTMLDALYRLNPVYNDKFVERDDYPRWRWKRDGRKEDLSQVTPIEAKFTLEEKDTEELNNILGEGVVSQNSVTVGRRYDGKLWLDISIDESRVLKNVLENHPRKEVLLKEYSTLGSLEESLKEGQEITEADVSAEISECDHNLIVLDRIKSIIGPEENLHMVAENIIKQRMPKFFHFASYQNLEGRIEVSSLRSAGGEAPGASSKQTARALLRLANTDIDSVTDDEFESRTAELEAVSSDLSREMSKYWTTNPELRIKVDVEPEIDRTASYGEKNVYYWLNFRVEDRKHDFTNNFSLRSSGYKWFFSFLAAFSEFEDHDDVVILLDEPALTLHAKAQRDFLRFINERLAPNGQVIYTTHSPFMVEQIERVRVVEDRGGEIGSITSSDSLEVGTDSAFPLQAALGYDISQNLFIGERNLLVEGPSDLVYLDLFSRRLRELEREGVDERWRILPAGGSSNVPAFVSLLGRKVDVTVLLDSGTEGLGKVEAAISANKIDIDKIVFVGSVLKQKHADIEDLFLPDDYLALYNTAFNKNYNIEELPQYPDRILLRLEKLDGKFDHWCPAEVLLRDPDRVEKISMHTLNNFEALAHKINSTHS